MKTVTVHSTWWVVLVRGILMAALAIFAFGHSIETLLALAIYIGVSLLITGILFIIFSISNYKTLKSWGWYLAGGVIDLFSAIVLLSNPAATALVLPFVIGFWMAFWGILLFVDSFAQKHAGNSNWVLSLIIGIFTVILGYLIMSNIVFGILTISSLIGTGLLCFGILNIIMSLEIKKLAF